MPRQEQPYRYTKVTPAGGWTYRRQIPQRLRSAFGGKASFRRALPGKPGDARFLEVYSRVHSEYERQLRAAEGAGVGATEPMPLQGEQLDGIAGHGLLRLLRFLQDRRTAEADIGLQRAATRAEKLLKGADSGTIGANAALLLLTPVLAELGIRPEAKDLPELQAALLDYAPIAAGDLQRRARRDHSRPDLEQIAPPLPVKTVTWEDLVACWRRSQGGTREKDGYGVSSAREQKHWRYIRQFQAWTCETHGETVEAGEVTADLFRGWRLYLQDSNRSAATARDAVACPAALFKCAQKEGLLTVNPAESQSLTLPKGYQARKKFSPFTQSEVCAVIRELKKQKGRHYYLMAMIAACSGARISEIYQLERNHLQQTKAGVWYFKRHFDPVDQEDNEGNKSGMKLKTGEESELYCPLHPVLVEVVLPELVTVKRGSLFPGLELNESVASRVSATMARVLKRLGLWEGKGGKRKLGWHSFRASFKDWCRESDIPVDYRAALCAHTVRDVGEGYGKGLQKMPDKLYAQLKRIDYEWLREC